MTPLYYPVHLLIQCPEGTLESKQEKINKKTKPSDGRSTKRLACALQQPQCNCSRCSRAPRHVSSALRYSPCRRQAELQEPCRRQPGGFPGGSVVENLPASAGDAGSVPGLRRSPGRGNGNPLQYSCRKLPGTEEPGRLQSMGLHAKIGHN